METGYLLSFTTGLLGGFGHCIGMCGPLVASCSFHAPRTQGLPLISHLLYNAGRITTYVFIGSLMGLTGTFLKTAAGLAGLQNVVSICAGAFMVIMGLSISGLFGLAGRMERHNSLVLKAVKVVLEDMSVWRYYPLGLLFGFLPCGLSYSIFVAAAGTGDVFRGMVTSFVFGLGTLPAMLLFGVLVGYLSARMRGLIYRAGGLAVIIMGILFIYRGVR